MQYTVVHSKDHYLLARLATDLQKEGIKEETCFNSNPFKKHEKWIAIEGDVFYMLNHKGCGDPIRHELTSRNYIKVLTQILEP